MNIVIAMDSFKECMTALEACNEVKAGFKEVFGDECSVKVVPMADGGEGTVQSLVDVTNGKINTAIVTGPMKNKVEAAYGILGDGKTAVIEMASASGLALVPGNKRNPLLATTYGTGELILAAIENGAENIILGIGGSATNDGGSGMASALGVKFLDKDQNELNACGGELGKIEKIDISNINPKIKNVKFTVACDVDNPLTGEKGASRIFGPQKGATEEMVKILDDNLKHYSKKISEYLGKDIENIPGSGAAGGLGGGCLAFLNTELKRGIEIVIAATNLEEAVKSADLVITGEGRIDEQTAFGKTPMGVAKVAKLYNIPVIALAGMLGKGYEAVYNVGIDSAFSIMQGVSDINTAIASGKENLRKTSTNIARMIKSLNLNK